MSSVEDVSDARRRAAERRAKRRQAETATEESAEAAGDGGAMLIRLNRVRPGARSVPAVPDEAGPPAVSPEIAPPAPHHHRIPLPGSETAVRLVERNPSLERLLASGRKRLSGALLGFVLMVVLPTIAAAVYYTFIASPNTSPSSASRCVGRTACRPTA